MGTGRETARSNSARPPLIEPVNAPAVMRGSRISALPVSTPSVMANTPAGAPAPDSASDTTSPVAADSSGCPGWATSTTGHPAANAEAVSPPATLNANGKLLAAHTATGPRGRIIRRRSGRGPMPQPGSAWSMVARR